MVTISQPQGAPASGVRYDRSANLAGRPRLGLPDEKGRPGASAPAPSLETGAVSQPLGQEALQELAREANQRLPASTNLKFQVERELDAVVVKVVDSQSNEVIRQIPNEEMVGLVKRMKNFRSGLMHTTA